MKELILLIWRILIVHGKEHFIIASKRQIIFISEGFVKNISITVIFSFIILIVLILILFTGIIFVRQIDLTFVLGKNNILWGGMNVMLSIHSCNIVRTGEISSNQIISQVFFISVDEIVAWQVFFRFSKGNKTFLFPIRRIPCKRKHNSFWLWFYRAQSYILLT